MKLPHIISESAENRAIVRVSRALKGIDANKVVFESFHGRSYSDNPRVISERLHERRPQTDIVWLLRDIEAARAKFGVPDYVRCVQFPSAEASAAAAFISPKQA